MSTQLEDSVRRLETLIGTLTLTDVPPFATTTERDESAGDIRRVLDALKDSTKPAKARNAIPPAPEDVTKYSAEIGYPLDGAAWCDHYSVKGWMVGKVKMKDWQAAVRLWKRSKWGEQGIVIRNGPTQPSRPGADYTRF